MGSGGEWMSSIWRRCYKIRMSVHMFLCVCGSMLMYNGSSDDEDVNVLVCVYVCGAECLCVCVFPCPPKPNTVNSSMLS